MINLLNFQKNPEYQKNEFQGNAMMGSSNQSQQQTNQSDKKLATLKRSQKQSSQKQLSQIKKSKNMSQTQSRLQKLMVSQQQDTEDIDQFQGTGYIPQGQFFGANRTQGLAIQNFPNPLTQQHVDLPISIVKPLRPKFERVASAHHNSQYIKKIPQIKQQQNINDQLLQNNNYFDQDGIDGIQNNNQDMGVQQAAKFFNTNFNSNNQLQDSNIGGFSQKPFTAGQLNQRKNYKNSSVSSVNNFMSSQKIQNNNFYQDLQNQNHQEYLKEMNDLEQKDVQIKDYRGIAETSFQRAQTAGLQKKLHHQKIQSLLNAEQIKNSGGKYYVNKVQLQDEQQVPEEYETFKINNDVRSHMQKFLRPTSQYTFTSGKRSTQASSAKYIKKSVKNKTQIMGKNNFMMNQHQLEQLEDLEEQYEQESFVSRQGLQTAQPKNRRKSSTNQKDIGSNEKRPNTQNMGGRIKKSGSSIAVKNTKISDLYSQAQNQKQKPPLIPIKSMRQQDSIQQKLQQEKSFQRSKSSHQSCDQSSFLSTTNNNNIQQNDYYMGQDSGQQQQQLSKDLDISQTQIKKENRIKKQQTKAVGDVKFDIGIKRDTPKNPSKKLQKINNNKEKEQDKTIGFDFEFDGITIEEAEYINIQNKRQKEFEDKYQITQQSTQNSARQKQQQLFMQQQQGALVVDKKDYLDSKYDNLEIKQEAVTKDVEFDGIFDHKENINDDLIKIGEDYKEKFEKYVKEDEQLFKELEDDKLHQLDFLKGDSGNHLSDLEVQFIKEEYEKESADRDYNQLDIVCSKLKFFTQFSRPTRIYLLKLAGITEYPSNSNIFEQGDEGNLMYIIVKGGVHVRIKRTNISGEEENPVFVTLYDGTQFGELALQAVEKKPSGLIATLMGDDQKVNNLRQVKEILEDEEKKKEEQEQERKRRLREQLDTSDDDEEKNLRRLVEKAEMARRAATIQTCESTTLFTISRDCYKTIIMNMMKKDLDHKLKLLQTLSFFDFFNSVSLMSLAKHMELQQFKLGEIILKEGTAPQYFYIIAKGRVKIVKEEMFVRKNQLLGLDSQQSKKKMNFGSRDYKDVVKGNQIYNKHKINKFEELDEDEDCDRQFEEIRLKSQQYKKIRQDQEKCLFKYEYNFGSLARSDFFMGRSMIQEYLKLDPKYASEIQNKNVKEPARLTVIADSANTEVYRIDKMKIYELPVFLRKVFIDGLTSKKEYDWEYDEQNHKLDFKDKAVLSQDKISFNQFMLANFGQNWVNQWEHFKTDLIKGHLNKKSLEKKQFK